MKFKKINKLLNIFVIFLVILLNLNISYAADESDNGNSGPAKPIADKYKTTLLYGTYLRWQYGEKYLTYENFSLEEIQSYIRFCIAYHDEEYYQPYYDSLPQSNHILVDYMKIKHPKIETIDNIYINFIDVEPFDWIAKNCEIYFTSNDKNYIAYAYIASDDIENSLYFELLDIKEG